MEGTDATCFWNNRFDQLTQRIAPRFGRKDLRLRAEGYLRGLLNRVERQNSWQLAEAVGDATPYGIQRLLGRARWDADAVRDDLRNYVVEHIGQPDGVLTVDETGFLKKGIGSAGVGRQYSGTAGRIENSQIGVFLAYHSTKGTALIDRSLYLPKAWTEDKARCREAGIPEDVAFATKPELARAMIRAAVKAKVPARWVTADEAYGIDHKFRRFIEESRLGYIVAVACSQRLFLGSSYGRANRFAGELPAQSWHRLSCGPGSKGQRIYDGAFIAFPFQATDEFHKGLLIRRSVTDPNEKAHYLCGFERGTTAEELVSVAGCRWGIETCFEQSKGEVGLDDYEVRSWDGWHRHITLAMFAYAFLVVIRAEAAQTDPKKSVDLLN